MGHKIYANFSLYLSAGIFTEREWIYFVIHELIYEAVITPYGEKRNFLSNKTEKFYNVNMDSYQVFASSRRILNMLFCFQV